MLEPGNSRPKQYRYQTKVFRRAYTRHKKEITGLLKAKESHRALIRELREENLAFRKAIIAMSKDSVDN